jgi:hypothetical protein
VRPLQRVAAEVVSEPGDRGEILRYLDGDLTRPTRVWQASVWFGRVEHLREVPTDFYQAAWRALIAQGFEPALACAAEVRRFLAAGPLAAPREPRRRLPRLCEGAMKGAGTP